MIHAYVLILSYVSIQSKFHHWISHTCIEDIALTSKLTSQHKFWIPHVNYAIMKLSWKSQNISFGIASTSSRVCMFVSCHITCNVLEGTMSAKDFEFWQVLRWKVTTISRSIFLMKCTHIYEIFGCWHFNFGE